MQYAVKRERYDNSVSHSQASICGGLVVQSDDPPITCTAIMFDGQLIKSITDRPDMVDTGEVHSLADIGHKHARCSIMPDIGNVAFVKDLVI